jgi:hypothetical protein
MRWSYKTVHYDMKKEGILGSAFLDEPEIELSLNQYGKAGWELVSLLETMDGLIAVFKQPFDLDTRSFSSSSDFPARMNRSPKELEKKPNAPVADFKRKNDRETSAEEVAEAIMLDEFEIEEDIIEKTVVKRSAPSAPSTPSAPPADVGMIRIE